MISSILIILNIILFLLMIPIYIKSVNENRVESSVFRCLNKKLLENRKVDSFTESSKLLFFSKLNLFIYRIFNIIKIKLLYMNIIIFIAICFIRNTDNLVLLNIMFIMCFVMSFFIGFKYLLSKCNFDNINSRFFFYICLLLCLFLGVFLVCLTKNTDTNGDDFVYRLVNYIFYILMLVGCNFFNCLSKKIDKIMQMTEDTFKNKRYSKILQYLFFIANIMWIETICIIFINDHSKLACSFYNFIMIIGSLLIIYYLFMYMYKIVIKNESELFKIDMIKNENKVVIFFIILFIVLTCQTIITYYTVKLNTNNYSNMVISSIDTDSYLSCLLNEMHTLLNSAYYTIISYVTLGFGDMTPVSWYAKLEAIGLSFSSLFTLIIFFNLFMNKGSNESKKN